MADTLNIRETHEATREDGTPFARLTVEYFGVSREDLLQLEGQLVKTLADRMEMGRQKLGKPA